MTSLNTCDLKAKLAFKSQGSFLRFSLTGFLHTASEFRLKPSSASTRQFISSESRASSLNGPAESSLLSPGLPQGRCVSNMPLGSHLPGVSPPSNTLASATDTILSANLPSIRSTGLLSLGQSTVDPGTKSPKVFFTAALGSSEKKRAKERTKERVKERVERLVSVVQGFSTAKGFTDGLYKHLDRWSCIFQSKPEVGFEDGPIPAGFEAEVAHRLRRLEQARHKIKKKNWGDTRLWLVCLAHEVEYISQWEDIDLYTSKGVNRMSAAITMAEKYLSTTSGDNKRGRNIVQVMRVGGPASLLEDGGMPQSM
jgi:hypothetical protein